MPNGNLRSYLDKNPGIDLNRKMEWIKGIAAGMDHLGKEGIVHRDLGIYFQYSLNILAARNILLGADLTPKISDCK